MNKDVISLIVSIITVVALVSGTVGVVFMAATIGVAIQDQGINKTETICNEIGLDVLSVSRQVFGDDYVVCYNKETNETRRVEV